MLSIHKSIPCKNGDGILIDQLTNLDNLIKSSRRQDRASQEALYKMLYPSLFALAKRFFSNDHEAIETVNDGMLKVFRKLDLYDPSKGNFLNWVYTIVRRAALDKLRGSFVEITQTSEVFIEQIEVARDFPDLEWKDIYRYLEVLPPATRTIFSLYYLDDLSTKEIAQQLNISAGTVKWHLSEGRKKLAPALKEYFSE